VPAADPRGLVSTILVLCRWLQVLLIGLWAGGMLAVGLLVAPHALAYFHTRVMAGQFLGPLFVMLIKGGIACGAAYLALLFVHDNLWRRYHRTAAGDFLLFLKFVIAAAFVGAGCYLLLRVWPAMDQYQHAAHVVAGAFTGGAGRAFDYWHKLFERVSQDMTAGGFVLILLTLMSRRRR
jgi:hypothetical protein